MSVDTSESAAANESEGSGSRAFAPDVDAKGMYLSPTLQQRVDLIEHLIEFGRQIIVLSGAIDSGKTTLLNHFATAQRSNWYTILAHGGPGLTGDALLALLAQELDVAVEPQEPNLREKVQQRIAALERAGKVVVLLVDDAEQLLAETSALVVSLAHADDQFAELRVLLAADLDQSALLESLQRAHSQHGLVHVVEIPQLTDSQVQALVEQRMSAVDLNAADYFAAEDYARIAGAADGIVGKVVTLARQHVAGISAPAAPRRARHRRAGRVAAGLSKTQVNLVFGVLAAGALAAGAWWATRNPLLPASQQTETVELKPPAPPAVPDAAVTPETSAPAAPLEPPGVTSATEVAVPTPAAGESVPVELPAAPAAVDAPASGVPAAPVVDAEQPLASPVPAPRVPETRPVPDAQPAAGVPQPAAPQVKSAPATTAPTLTGPATPPAPPATPVVKSAAAKPAANTAAPVLPALSAAWLLKQPAGAHTLQLFGVRERRAAERYRIQRGIATQSTILTGTLDGKPWYVVVYGVYPNRAAAVSAMTRLPASLRDTQPWARSIGSLRGVLH